MIAHSTVHCWLPFGAFCEPVFQYLAGCLAAVQVDRLDVAHVPDLEVASYVVQVSPVICFSVRIYFYAGEASQVYFCVFSETQ